MRRRFPPSPTVADERVTRTRLTRAAAKASWPAGTEAEAGAA